MGVCITIHRKHMFTHRSHRCPLLRWAGRAAFMAAVQTNPTDAECIYNLACVASLLGDHAQAQATLEAAVANAADSAETLVRQLDII